MPCPRQATPWPIPPRIGRPQLPPSRSPSASPRPRPAQRPARAVGWFRAAAPARPRAPARSRSPPSRGVDYDDAFPPLRSDAPGRRAHGRGALPSLSSAAERTAALVSLDRDRYASSSLKAQAALWRTTLASLKIFQVEPFPPSREALEALGATLKVGGYTSAENYLSHYRVRCRREGFGFDDVLNRVYSEVVRSCTRGMGAPVKALALPLLKLVNLDIKLALGDGRPRGPSLRHDRGRLVPHQGG